MIDNKVWFVTGSGRGMGVDPASAARAVQASVARFGRIDVLVNNAGNFNAGFSEELTAEAF